MNLIDKDAFCELIKINEKAMYSLAFSLVRNEADAAEVISESIYRAYKNIASLKNGKAFKTWILKIIHHTAVEYIRKNTHITPMEEIERINKNDNNNIETKISLRQAVEKLKQPYRTVVLLFYYEDLSIMEISKITNTTVITVKQQLSRSRKQLRKILKEDFWHE